MLQRVEEHEFVHFNRHRPRAHFVMIIDEDYIISSPVL
jgi:hypothetical protein